MIDAKEAAKRAKENFEERRKEDTEEAYERASYSIREACQRGKFSVYNFRVNEFVDVAILQEKLEEKGFKVNRDHKEDLSISWR